MHVAIDPQTFALQRYGGISRYFLETASSLARLADTRVSVLALAHINAYLGTAGDAAVVGRRLPVVPEPLRPFLVRANQALARRWLTRHGADIVHETYYSHARTAPPGVPTVITVFDMIHEKFPDYAPRTRKVARAKRAAIGRADHVICISENTRRDLLALYGLEPSRASVVTLGFSLQAGARDLEQPSPVELPYVLFVGKRGGYKDFATLLRAYAAAREVARGHLLVCFGDAGFTRPELQMMDQLGVPRARVRHAAGDDAALAAHYRHASLFVYPSRYEGFGMPPLEAMAFDCPVVCSDAASLPEVVGDAAAMFAAGDAEALRAAMARVLESPATAAALREKGRARLGRFSWDGCARQTRAIYASVLEGGRQGGDPR
jgi:glycosyltransferase involved in cell wall biosynthesis